MSLAETLTPGHSSRRETGKRTLKPPCGLRRSVTSISKAEGKILLSGTEKNQLYHLLAIVVMLSPGSSTSLSDSTSARLTGHYCYS